MIHEPPGSFATATARAARAPSEDRSESVPLPTWGAAAALILGLHAGLYWVLTRPGAAEPPQQPESPAAVMVNLAPIPVTAASQADNQAEGPPATAVDETAMSEEPPPVPPVETAPSPPDVTPQAVLPVASPKPPPPKAEPRKREKPPEKPVTVRKPKPRDDRVAARNGGGPRATEQTASRTAAPSAGEAVSAASRASWQGEVRSRIVRAKRFPSEAHGVTGVAVVSATFTASGTASGVRLVTSSGNAALDAEAVAVMYRGAPYPPPPGGRPIILTVPLNFRRS